MRICNSDRHDSGSNLARNLARFCHLLLASCGCERWEGDAKHKLIFERRKLNWKIFSSGGLEHYVRASSSFVEKNL